MEEQIKAVKRMQQYILDNLNNEISFADLSKVSLYSPWHSYRLFIEKLGVTPADYIRKLRLSTSALKLRDSKQNICEIAFEVGFNSVDGYQRAFNKEFGCNPKEYSINPIPLYLFNPYIIEISKKGENNMDSLKVFTKVVEKPARKVIIKRGIKAEDYFEYCEEVGCDVWGLLLSICSVNSEPVCLWLTDSLIKPGTSKYVQGVEVELSYNKTVPEGFDIIELPACKYLQFKSEKFAEEDYCNVIENVWETQKSFDISSLGYEWDNFSPRIQLEPIGERGYIELVAIKDII